MSILSQIETNENEVIDCVERFFSKHHIGKLLSKCNGTKEKGVPAISILRYKLGNIFASGSMYVNAPLCGTPTIISRSSERLYFCIISCILQGVHLTRTEASRRNHCSYHPCVPGFL